MTHILYLLLLVVALVGLVWFLLDTIADASNRLFGCKHNVHIIEGEYFDIARCMWCAQTWQIPKGAAKEIQDPTIPEDEPATLRLIRGGLDRK